MAPREVQRARDALARNMRVHRAVHDLSQNGLADEAGTTQATVSAIELRKANPTLDTLGKIAHALGVEVDALFSRPDRTK